MGNRPSHLELPQGTNWIRSLRPAYLLLLLPLFFRRGRKYSWVLFCTCLVFLRSILARVPLLGRFFPRLNPQWALSQEVLVSLLKQALRSLPPDLLRSLFQVFGWMTRSFVPPRGIATRPMHTSEFKAVWIFRQEDAGVVEQILGASADVDPEAPDSDGRQHSGSQLESFMLALRSTAKEHRRKLQTGVRELKAVAGQTFRLGSLGRTQPSQQRQQPDPQPGGRVDDPVVIINIHGGMFLFGNAVMWLPFQANLLQQLAEHELTAHRRFVILSVDYSLSPDAKWPMALKETLSAHQWLTIQGRLPADNIVFMGDSAGGNLAVAAALAIRDQVFEVVSVPDRSLQAVDGESAADPPMQHVAYLAPPAALVLISPWLDLNNRGTSFQTNAAYDYLHTQTLSRAAADYLQGEHAGNPLCSPLLVDDVQGLPHIMCLSGGKELFRDDIRLFMDRVSTSKDPKTRVFHVEEEDMVHNYPLLVPGGFRKASRRATSHIAQFLGNILLLG